MLGNPAEIVIRTTKENDDKLYVGRVYVYGYDTKSVGNMVEFLGRKKNVQSVKVIYPEVEVNNG